MAFKYYLKSASSSFARNGIVTLASFITVSCCLFLFGVFFLFTINMNSITKQIESQCELIARIDIEADEQKEQEIYNEILRLDNVAGAELETKEQAFNNFKKTLENGDQILEGLESENFLRSSVKITLQDIRETKETEALVRRVTGVAEVKNQQNIVDKVIKFTSAAKNGSAFAMLVLLIIAIFIIQNTIKMSVFARVKEIQIMKFVGATDHFIRMPFILEGIMIGSLGFLVSFAIIAFGYNAVATSTASFTKLFTLLSIQECIIPLAISMALFGVLMGAIGSALSLKKHLKV